MAPTTELRNKVTLLRTVLKMVRDHIWSEYCGTWDCCASSWVEVTLEPATVKDEIDSPSFDAIQEEANVIKAIDEVLGVRHKTREERILEVLIEAEVCLTRVFRDKGLRQDACIVAIQKIIKELS